MASLLVNSTASQYFSPHVQLSFRNFNSSIIQYKEPTNGQQVGENKVNVEQQQKHNPKHNPKKITFLSKKKIQLENRK
eukprot:Pgem_evm1s2279